MDSLFRARTFSDIRHRFGLAVFSHNDLPRHRPGDQSEPAGGLRGRNHYLAGTKVGCSKATTSALPAVMAGRAPVQRLGQNRQPRGHAQNIQLVAGLLDDGFGAARWRWRQEDSVGRAGNILFTTENSDVGLHLVVVRRHVLVGDRPVVAHPIAGTGFEIYRREAQSDSSPVIGAPSNNAGAEPAEL